MAEPWTILSKRYGGDVRNPSSQELALAAAELFVENLPGMTESTYEEHGAAFLRHGYDDGPMYVLLINRGGTATFEQWIDQDFSSELEPPMSLRPVGQEEAVRLWQALAAGRLAEVRQAFGANNGK